MVEPYIYLSTNDIDHLFLVNWEDFNSHVCLHWGVWTLWFAKLCSNIISFLQASLLFDFNLWPHLVGPTTNLDKETQILKKCYQNQKIDFNNTNKFGFCESQYLCPFSLVAVNLKVRFSKNERFWLNKERESVELKLKFVSFFFSLLFFYFFFFLWILNL